MIEKHYARWLRDDEGQLARLSDAPDEPERKGLEPRRRKPYGKPFVDGRKVPVAQSGGGEIRTLASHAGVLPDFHCYAGNLRPGDKHRPIS